MNPVDALAAALPPLVTFTAIAAWFVTHRGKRAESYARVDKQQVGGWLKRIYEIAFWTARPWAHAVARRGLRADTVSWIAAGLGIVAGLCTGAGLVGVAGAFLFASGILDVVDGEVARQRRTSSRAGAVLDSTLDRIVDFLVHAGAAFLWRDEPVLLCVALAAAHGSFLISYTSALADREGIEAPRGRMKRTERGPLLVLGSCLAAWSAPLEASLHLPHATPLAFMNLVIAVGANVTAFRRLQGIRSLLR